MYIAGGLQCTHHKNTERQSLSSIQVAHIPHVTRFFSEGWHKFKQRVASCLGGLYTKHFLSPKTQHGPKSPGQIRNVGDI